MNPNRSTTQCSFPTTLGNGNCNGELFPQDVNEKSVKLAVSAVSLNILHDFTLFVTDIHQIMIILLFFPTPFDHFHFHPTLGQDPALILTLRHM